MKNTEYLKLMSEWMDQNRIARDGRFDADNEELDYWTTLARESNGPTLEIACGSGRVLIPLLEREIDISGVDNSDAMLKRCRAMSAKRGVSPVLYNQSVQRLDIPRTFGLIFGNAGFLSLFTEDVDIKATLESVWRHLKPGGRFVCTFEQATEDTLRWCNASQGWKGDYFQASNGALYAHRSIHKDCTSTPNIWRCVLVIEKYVDGRLVETEANQRAGRLFSVEEVVKFFESAGFEEIRAHSGFTDQPAKDDVKMITVITQRLE